ncbi:ABC transporter permease [Herbiconiux sp. YIM B11900]|uniref:ABC transporter permease n=1 Tax=Herbiconiux sp. YIM B11900 TaxID=3404131 RepID=UPI003F831CFC
MTALSDTRPPAPGPASLPPTAPRSSHVLADSATMLRRNLLHLIRYPGLSVFTILGPVVMLLLFVFVFGGTLGAGLPGAAPSAGGPADGREAYLAYVMPGILAITIAGSAGGIATTVAMDMTEGITARFRSMAISRAAVLAGHVLGNTVQALIAVVLVLGVGLAIGFRPTAGPAEWLAAAGILTLIAFAISWLGVAMGMQARSVETASNLPLVLLFLPFLGSGFVPTESMPGWLQGFAQYQPFTPFIETIRALLLGTPLGSSALWGIGWCVLLTVAGYAWARALYERRSVR